MKRAITSASNVFRRALCPGSEKMETGLGDTESEYSTEGTLLHSLYFTAAPPAALAALTPEQRETLESANADTEKFFAAFRSTVGIPDDAPFTDAKEVELRIADGDIELTGHADIVRTWAGFDAIAVADVKFGYGENEDAPDNIQLCCYAVMARMPSTRAAGVALIQPRNFGPRCTMAFYGADGLDAAQAEIMRIVASARLPDAPLVATDSGCRFCKATAICPAWRARYMNPAKADLTPIAPLALELVTADDLVAGAAVITACRGKRGDEWMAEMKRRVEAGTLPGWRLQSTGDVVKCTDALGLFTALKGYFGDALTAADFDACRDLRWGQLEELIGALSGLSEKKAKDFLKEFTAPFVERTPKAMRVVVDKAAKQLT